MVDMTHKGTKCANDDSGDTDTEDSQPVKRQKLLPSDSFANILQNMKPNTENEWARSSPPQLNSTEDSVVFQCTDIQERSSSNSIPTILLFGATEAGNSIMMHVRGFMPYFYFPAPTEFKGNDTEELLSYLNDLLPQLDGPVQYVEIIEKRRAAGGKLVPFIKITVKNTNSHVFRTGRCEFRELFSDPERTYEADVSYLTRFIVDTKIAAMTWVEIPAGKYKLLSPREKHSRCQLELCVRHDSLTLHELQSRTAPLRILSFDLECEVPTNLNDFSDGRIHKVYQIANMVTLHSESEPFIRNVFTLDSCEPIEGTQLLSFEKEIDMLKRWQEFVQEVDPDVVIGYNICRFDLPYLLVRAEALKVDSFSYLGRLNDTRMSVQPRPQKERTWKMSPMMEGRLSLDLLHYMLKYHRQGSKSCKLGPVCEYFLGEKKEDVSWTEINGLQNKDSESRRLMAVYCSKDAYLPLKLFEKLEALQRYSKDAESAGVPFNALIPWEDKAWEDKSIQRLQKFCVSLRSGCALPDQP